MLILGIDTSTHIGSTALWSDNGLIGLLTISVELTHSEGLMSAIDKLLQLAQKNVREISGVACVSGPGSYTGLRVGVATAQGIAFANNAECYAMNSLDVMAWNLAHSKYQICPLLTARKGWVYARLYQWNDNVPLAVSDELNLQPEELIREIHQPTIFYGSGLNPHCEFLREVLQEQFVEIPQIYHSARADILAEIAAHELAQGKGITPDQLLPHYLGPSQAEINWNKIQLR